MREKTSKATTERTRKQPKGKLEYPQERIVALASKQHMVRRRFRGESRHRGDGYLQASTVARFLPAWYAEQRLRSYTLAGLMLRGIATRHESSWQFFSDMHLVLCHQTFIVRKKNVQSTKQIQGINAECITDAQHRASLFLKIPCFPIATSKTERRGPRSMHLNFRFPLNPSCFISSTSPLGTTAIYNTTAAKVT